MPNFLKKRNIDWTLVLICVTLFIVALVMWMPFGFQMLGTAEEWRIMADYDQVLRLGESYNRLRPLQTAPMLLAYLIQPNSFEAMNVMMFLAFFFKGLGLFLFLRIIFPKHTGIVVFSALLFAAFPADEGLFVLRDIPHHIAVAFLAFSCYFALNYAKGGRWYIAALYSVTTVISLFIYEVGYLIAFLILFLPFFVGVSMPYRKRFLGIGALTIGICIGMVAFNYLRTPPTEEALYQAQIVQQDILSPSVINSMLDSIIRMYNTHFVSGWMSAIEQLNLHPNLTILAAILSLVCGIYIWWVSRSDAEVQPVKLKSAFLLIIIGLGFMLAGYIIFVPSSIRHDNWRVYLYTSAAAGFVISLFLYTLVSFAKLKRLLFSIFAIFILFLTFTKALNQHAHFQENSAFIKNTMVQIVSQAPQLTQPVSFVFLNSPPARDLHIDMFYHHESVKEALRYIYHNEMGDAIINSDFCVDDPIYRSKACVFATDGLYIEFGGVERVIPYDELLLFRYDENLVLTLLNQLPSNLPEINSLYQPSRLISLEASLPTRMQSLFHVSGS